MNTKLGILCVGVSVAALTACSPVKLPPIAKYTITNYQHAVTQPPTNSQRSLLITTPVAASGYQSDRMIYMQTPYRLQSYSRNKWVAPPAQMMLPILEQAVKNTRRFYAVVTPPFSGRTTYRLDTDILALQQEFIRPDSQVRLIVKAILVNNKTNKVVASQTYKILMPTSMKTPYGGVIATTQAANKVAQRIAGLVARNVS